MKIGSSNDSAAVKAQYAVPKGLDIRVEKCRGSNAKYDQL